MLKMTTANIFEGREWGKRMNKSKTALSKKKKKKIFQLIGTVKKNNNK